jgi:ribonuclease J
MAVLSRLSTGRHSQLHLMEGDTVVLSSHTIPGNEERTFNVINRLFQRGADVYYHPLAKVHVSGHASQEEQKLLINLLSPRYFVPIHGELRHLKEHGKIAQQVGIPQENIAVVENGHELIFDGERLRIGDRVPGEYVFVDGALVGEVGPRLINEREMLGRSGFVTAFVHYDRQAGKPLAQPCLVTRGFVFVPESEALLLRARDVVRSAASVKAGTSPDEVEQRIEHALSQFLYQETGRNPVVVAAVLED